MSFIVTIGPAQISVRLGEELATSHDEKRHRNQPSPDKRLCAVIQSVASNRKNPHIAIMETQFQSQSDTRFIDRIRTSFPSLQPAERQLGTFLLDFPGDLASYDAQEVARLAGVSKATVSRFIRKLGYENYDTARRAVRDEATAGSRFYLGHGDPKAIQDMLDFGMGQEIENLTWTFQRIDPDDLEHLAEQIITARKIWILGHRISHAFATYLRWQLVKIVPDVSVIPKDGESMGEHLVAIQKDDLVITIALRRRIKGISALMDQVQKTGAATAIISDDSMPPDPAASWHFRCKIDTATQQFNHAAVLALCYQLVVRATIKAGSAGRARLRRIDEMNEALEQYD